MDIDKHDESKNQKNWYQYLKRHFKLRNATITIISISSFLIMLYNFTIKNSMLAIPEDKIIYLILFFIAMIALYLVNSSVDNDDKHSEIKSTFNRQDNDRTGK